MWRTAMPALLPSQAGVTVPLLTERSQPCLALIQRRHCLALASLLQCFTQTACKGACSGCFKKARQVKSGGAPRIYKKKKYKIKRIIKQAIIFIKLIFINQL